MRNGSQPYSKKKRKCYEVFKVNNCVATTKLVSKEGNYWENKRTCCWNVNEEKISKTPEYFPSYGLGWALAREHPYSVRAFIIWEELSKRSQVCPKKKVKTNMAGVGKSLGEI